MQKKSIFKSKTFWIAVIQAIIAIILVVEANYPELKTAGGILIVKSVLDVFLRHITTDQIQ